MGDFNALVGNNKAWIHIRGRVLNGGIADIEIQRTLIYGNKNTRGRWL